MKEHGKKWLCGIENIKCCGSCCHSSIANPGSPWGYSSYLHWISRVTVTYYKDVLWCVPHKCPQHHTLFLSSHSPPTPGPRTLQPTAMSCRMPSCSHEQQLSEKWIQKKQSIKTETAVTILHSMVLISGYILHTCFAFLFSSTFPKYQDFFINMRKGTMQVRISAQRDKADENFFSPILPLGNCCCFDIVF